MHKLLTGLLAFTLTTSANALTNPNIEEGYKKLFGLAGMDVTRPLQIVNDLEQAGSGIGGIESYLSSKGFNMTTTHPQLAKLAGIKIGSVDMQSYLLTRAKILNALAFYQGQVELELASGIGIAASKIDPTLAATIDANADARFIENFNQALQAYNSVELSTLTFLDSTWLSAWAMLDTIKTAPTLAKLFNPEGKLGLVKLFGLADDVQGVKEAAETVEAFALSMAHVVKTFEKLTKDEYDTAEFLKAITEFTSDAFAISGMLDADKDRRETLTGISKGLNAVNKMTVLINDLNKTLALFEAVRDFPMEGSATQNVYFFPKDKSAVQRIIYIDLYTQIMDIANGIFTIISEYPTISPKYKEFGDFLAGLMGDIKNITDVFTNDWKRKAELNISYQNDYQNQALEALQSLLTRAKTVALDYGNVANEKIIPSYTNLKHWDIDENGVFFGYTTQSTQFSGGISTNGIEFKQDAAVCLPDNQPIQSPAGILKNANITVNLSVDPSHVGQYADIIVAFGYGVANFYMGCTPSEKSSCHVPFSGNEWYSIDNVGNIHTWFTRSAGGRGRSIQTDVSTAAIVTSTTQGIGTSMPIAPIPMPEDNIAQIIPWKTNVRLEENMSFQVYNADLPLERGILHLYVGYRLKNNSLLINGDPIKAIALQCADGVRPIIPTSETDF